MDIENWDIVGSKAGEDIDNEIYTALVFTRSATLASVIRGINTRDINSLWTTTQEDLNEIYNRNV